MKNYLVLLIGLLSVATAKNCYLEDDPSLTYIYRRADYSGNYSAVKEYWLNQDTECDFISGSSSKLDWYSTDIAAEYQLYYYDIGDGSPNDLCSRVNDDWTPY